MSAASPMRTSDDSGMTMTTQTGSGGAASANRATGPSPDRGCRALIDAGSVVLARAGKTYAAPEVMADMPTERDVRHLRARLRRFWVAAPGHLGGLETCSKSGSAAHTGRSKGSAAGARPRTSSPTKHEPPDVPGNTAIRPGASTPAGHTAAAPGMGRGSGEGEATSTRTIGAARRNSDSSDRRVAQ